MHANRHAPAGHYWRIIIANSAHLRVDEAQRAAPPKYGI